MVGKKRGVKGRDEGCFVLFKTLTQSEKQTNLFDSRGGVNLLI